MLSLIISKDEFLAKREVDKLINKLKVSNSDSAVIDLEAKLIEKGELEAKLSPNLFGESSIVTVWNSETGSDEFFEDALKIIECKLDVNLIIVHSGAIKGKKLVESIKKLSLKKDAFFIQIPELKKESEILAFINAEMRLYDKNIAVDAVKIIYSSVESKDLRSLSGICKQLANDSESKTLTKEFVLNFFSQVNGVDNFEIANMAVAGDLQNALLKLNEAYLLGVSPISIINLIALRLRQIIDSFRVKQGSVSAYEVGLQPFMINNNINLGKKYTMGKFRDAFESLKNADYAAKGGSKDEGKLALEKVLFVLAK